MSIPVALPIAGGIGRGVAQGISAAIRYGPALLQLADAFRRPGGLGGTVADTPKRERLAKLIEDAIRGAQLPVALPPSPGFPGPGGLGPLGPLMPWDKAARAIAAALGKIAQGWGSAQGPKITLVTGQWEPLSDYEERFSEPATITIEWEGETRFDRVNCGNGTTFFGVSKPNDITTREGVTGWGMYGWIKATLNSPCGSALGWSFAGVGFFFDTEDGERETLLVAGPRDRQALLGFDTTFKEIYTVKGVTLNGEEHLPLVGVALDFPGGLDGWPELEGEPATNPPIQLDPVGPDIGPVLPPVAGPLPADPNAEPGPDDLEDLAPVVPPALPVVPRPLPGPVLPDYEPEPEPAPAEPNPSRPTIPGDRPGPILPGPVRPFPDVPTEPGQFPNPDPGPGPGPDPDPGPGPVPDPGPDPGPGPGPVPQPGPPAIPTQPDGEPVTPRPRPDPDTPDDQHKPTDDDDPVRGNGPAATLKAIAQEMGRQEQKLSRLLERVGRPNDQGGGNGAMLDLLGQILGLLLSADGPGGYAINSPCNQDPETGEQRPDLESTWGFSLTMEQNILKRVDALAELLQHHKDLPQPICGRPRPTGEPVTVTFEQIPDDLSQSG